MLVTEKNKNDTINRLDSNIKTFIYLLINARIRNSDFIKFEKVYEEVKKGVYFNDDIKVSEKIIKAVIDKINGFTDKDLVSDKKVLYDTVITSLNLVIEKGWLISKDGEKKMEHKEPTAVISEIFNMLTGALTDPLHEYYIPPSTDNANYRQLLESAISLLEPQIKPDLASVKSNPVSWVERVSATNASRSPALTLPNPETDRDQYEHWKNRSIDKIEKPLDFLHRVWGKYINAGVMYQTDLRGSRGNTEKIGLDNSLFQAVAKQCREENLILNNYLPNKSKKVDRELEELIQSGDFKEKINTASRLLMASRNRRDR